MSLFNFPSRPFSGHTVFVLAGGVFFRGRSPISPGRTSPGAVKYTRVNDRLSHWAHQMWYEFFLFLDFVLFFVVYVVVIKCMSQSVVISRVETRIGHFDRSHLSRNFDAQCAV